MMLRGFSLPLLAIVAIAGAAEANSESSSMVPAEIPPVGFTGAEYVDSAGCAFVRARIGGATKWLPRLSHDRVLVCGLEPSLVPPKSETVEALQPVPETVSEVIAAAPAAVSKPRPAPRTVKAASSKSAMRSVPETRLATATVRVTCPSRNGATYSYVAQPGDPITCSAVTQAAAEYSTEAAKPIKTLPRPPKGYKYAFGEGRHNPNRGERTQAGTASMNRIWTQDVPSRLVAPNAAHLSVQAKGYRSTREPLPDYRVSSKANAAPAALRLQAGSYGSRNEATTAARDLATHGMSVRIVHGKRGGQRVHVVLAGPFNSSQSAQAALRIARGSGFHDARLRQ